MPPANVLAAEFDTGRNLPDNRSLGKLGQAFDKVWILRIERLALCAVVRTG